MDKEKVYKCDTIKDRVIIPGDSSELPDGFKEKAYKPINPANNNLTPRYGSLVGNAGLSIPSEEAIKKAIVFVDANNWYHNVKKYYNPSDVDIVKVADFIKNLKKYSIAEIRWYVSVPSIEDGEKMYFQHLSFLDHLRNRGVKVISRKLQRLSNKEILKKKRILLDSLELCRVCRPLVESQFLEIADIRKKEKGIDVASAVDMINKCLIEGECDVCVLISGDADFTPALELIKKSGKEVLSSAVPAGYSSELREKFPYLILNPELLKECFRDYEKKKEAKKRDEKK